MKYRVVREASPATFIYQPTGEEEDRTEEINLTFEELEAVALINLDNLSQRDAADNMSISQPTFNRLLNGAYQKLTQFLVSGKRLRIEGGNYMIAQSERFFLCYNCQAEFSVPYGTPRPTNCPNCNSTNIHRHPDDTGARHRGGRGQGGGRGRGGGYGGGRGQGGRGGGYGGGRGGGNRGGRGGAGRGRGQGLGQNPGTP